MGRLDGRVAFITEAGRGIGLATAVRFAEEGARVCISDVDESSATVTTEQLSVRGLEAFAVEMDITDRFAVDSAMEETVSRYGKLDILVNNAGITRDNLIYKMTDEEWKTVMDVDLTGAFYCSRAAQRYMVDQNYGRIINVSSVSALGERGQANYSAATAGLQGFTKALAAELGRFGVTVNCVAPGFVETEITRATAARMGLDFEALSVAAIKDIPVGRIGEPEDVASSILFFALEEASFVSGQVLYVAGGPKE